MKQSVSVKSATKTNPVTKPTAPVATKTAKKTIPSKKDLNKVGTNVKVSVASPKIEWPIVVQINSKQIVKVLGLTNGASPKNIKELNDAVTLLKESADTLKMYNDGGMDLAVGFTAKDLASMVSDSISALRAMATVKIEPILVEEKHVLTVPDKPAPAIKKVADNKVAEELAKKVSRQGGVVLGKDQKPLKAVAKPSAPVAPKKAVVSTVVKPKTPSVSTKKEPVTTGKPYGKFGFHGHNVDHPTLEAGDQVGFMLKGNVVIGEFVHVHVNNHSPNGYAVIRYNGKIYERVLDKIEIDVSTSKSAPTKPVVAKPKAK
jgi:hypothetical protein